MKISISVHDQNQITSHGYGQATFQIVRALQTLGHSVQHEDPSAQVEFCFSQPYLWKWFNPDSYKIGMSAWESDKIPSKWKPGLETCDEFWTPSPLIAEWFAAEGYPAKVFEHGVDADVWSPRPRLRKGPVRFLHIGEPAPRKSGQLVYDTFKELYGNSDEASLTIKAYYRSTIRGNRNAHPDKELNNVTIMKDMIEEWQLVNLVHRHDVLVYPSWGEGFGLIPLQAMATGMPVICTENWAPYNNLLIPRLKVSGSLDKSPWPFHTGRMFRPSAEDVRSAMKYAVENFDKVSKQAFTLTPFVTKRYDWVKLTEQAFAPVLSKIEF